MMMDEVLEDRDGPEIARYTGPEVGGGGAKDWDDWERPERRPPNEIPTLHLDGFDGPMDLLLDLAERQVVDLGKISIVALAEQFAAALEALGGLVPIEQRADWVVLAARLVLLRARLLYPANPEAAADAEREADAELRRIRELAVLRAAAAWLQARPQLGQDVFTRPRPEETREVGYVALMEACLVLLRGRPATEFFAPPPLYRQVIPDLWRISDAIERIQKMLPDYPEGAFMTAFMPGIAAEDSNRALKARAAVASTFVAGLELAKQEVLGLDQSALFEPITYHPCPTSAATDRKRA